MLLEICVAAKSPEKLRDTPIQKWYWSDSSLLCVSMSIRAVKRKCKLLSMNHESKARAACLSMSQHIMSCNFPPLKMTHQVWKRALFSESAWVYRWGAFKIHDNTGYAVKLCSEVEMVLRKGELTIIYMNIINVEHVCIFLSLSLSLWYWYVCARPLSVPGWYGRATEYVHILLHDVPFSYMSLLAGSLEQRHPNNTKVSNVHCGFSSILRSSFSMILCWWSILGKLWKRYRSRCIRIINQTPGHSPSGCRSKVVTATWSTQKGTCWSSRREPGAKAFPVSSGQAASSDELFVDHTVLRAICAWCTYTCV